MGKRTVDTCDLCEEEILTAKGGVEISGQNIIIHWAGKNSPKEDVFANNGSHAPLNGRTSLVVCNECLLDYFKKDFVAL